MWRTTTLTVIIVLSIVPVWAQDEASVRLEEMTGKTIMLFGAHPDDEFPAAGTMAILQKNGNTVIVVTFTNGNKGSLDPEMTSERLARIRHQESLAGLKVLGIPPAQYINLGYDDGYVEFADKLELMKQVVLLIRQYRPDAVLAHEIGPGYVRWLKADHRIAALVTADACRMAMFHLNFPDQILYENVEPFQVRNYYFFETKDPNYFVDITDVLELKARMRVEHISQAGSNWQKYTGTVSAEERKALLERFQKRAVIKDGKPCEVFRYYSGGPDSAGKEDRRGY